MIRHLFQRTIRKNGKTFKAWYYWYYDENGKQVRKSCGKDGRPCLKKRDAEAFIAGLDDENQKRETLAELFTGMYDPGSAFMRKLALKGKENLEHTISIKQKYLRLILAEFGERYPDEISPGEIDMWLLTFDRSNSWRNQALRVFKDIFRELYSFRKIQFLPELQKFAPDKRSRGILSVAEIKRLFPDDYSEIIRIWRWNTRSHEPDWQIFSFATLIFTMLSTGMRSGEARAVKYSQFVAENAILINCFLDYKLREVNRLKKGTDTNKRWRVSILPRKTVEMIKYMTEIRQDSSPYLFTFHGRPWKSLKLCISLASVLTKNGIDAKARNITPHSLRFTYNTIMKSKINNVDLRLMMGHLDEQMTDYYDKSKATDHLDDLQKNREIIDGIWE